MIIQSYSPGGANSTITGESRWALPRILVIKAVMSARQPGPSVKFIHPVIVRLRIKSQKSYVVLVTALVDMVFLASNDIYCRHIVCTIV